jgi:hypothetical protein
MNLKWIGLSIIICYRFLLAHGHGSYFHFAATLLWFFVDNLSYLKSFCQQI